MKSLDTIKFQEKKGMGQLKDLKIKAAKPKGKDYKLTNGDGLYLLVKTNGTKSWRYNYRYLGKQKTLAYGVYPTIPLKKAKELHNVAKEQLASGVDPALKKQLDRYTQENESFGDVADNWLHKKSFELAPATLKRQRELLNNDILPYIGTRPISEIETIELNKLLQRIVNRQALGTARKAVQLLGQVFRYAKQTGQIKYNPATELSGVLPKPKAVHRAAITEPKKFGKLLRDIDSYKGSHIARTALALAPLVFVRPNELCSMEWSEIDFRKKTWTIPIEKKKERSQSSEDHIVPLSRQVMALLKDIKPLTGEGKYVFPNQRNQSGHFRVESLNKTLKQMGYDTKNEHTSHGFRASARTMLDEQLNMRVDWIEQQLAHKVIDSLGRAYNRTKHLKERKDMMQKWADYLDDLKQG